MTIDSSGRYTLPNGYVVNGGDIVLPSQHNPPLQDIELALNQVSLRDGRAPMTGLQSLFGDGVSELHGVTKRQLDAGVLSATQKYPTTVAGTADAIQITFTPASPMWALNERIYWRSTGANTIIAPTISRDAGVTFKTIKRLSGVALEVGDTGAAGYECMGVYNGTDVILQNPATAILFKRPETGAVQSTYYARAKSQMRLTDFGAVPDGYTDSTAAINAAIAAAEINGSDLYVPAGVGPYVTSGITLGGGISRGFKMIGEGRNAKSFLYPSASFMLKAGVSGAFASLVTIQQSTGIIGGSYSQSFYEFERLSFFGNKAFVSAGTISKVFDIQDHATANTDGYPVGIRMIDCSIEGGKNGGIYIGLKRQSDIRRTKFYDNGSSTGDIALLVNTYDVVLDNLDIGGNAGTGLYLNNGAQIAILYTTVHTSNIGFVCSNSVVDFTWVQGSIDRNNTYGAIISKNTNGTYPGGGRMFTDVKFHLNGRNADNAYPDVNITDDGQDTVFSQCHFLGHGETPALRQPYPLLFSNGAARTRTIGCNFATSKFSSGLVANNLACVEQTASKLF